MTGVGQTPPTPPHVVYDTPDDEEDKWSENDEQRVHSYTPSGEFSLYTFNGQVPIFCEPPLFFTNSFSFV
jgi:hypothetical protein